MDLERRLEELERRVERLESLGRGAVVASGGAGTDPRIYQDPPSMLGEADGNGNGGSTASPAGRAAADAWLPTGPEVRHADRWIQGDPRGLGPGSSSEAAWRERVAGGVGDRRPEPDEGLRLRFVMESVPADTTFDLVRMAQPVLAVLQPGGVKFIHLEVMRGPESGLHVAFDNRMPALLTQHWVPSIGEAAAQALTPPTGMPAGCPLHVNIALHEGVFGGAAFQEGGDIPSILQAAASTLGGSSGPVTAQRIHQLTVAGTTDHPSGFSIGVEQVHDEQGAGGGNPAVGPQGEMTPST